MSKITVGQRGTFYPWGTAAKPGQPISAEVIHVWSDTCVNLQTERSHTETSVLVYRGGLDEVGAPKGYFFVPEAQAAAEQDPIEAAIVAAGATVAPRITPADVEANIASEHYFTAAQGEVGAHMASLPAAPIPGAHPALALLTFCVLVLRNGFTCVGTSACASPENFNAEIGRKVARSKALDDVWKVMGYELRSRLAAGAAGSTSS